MTPTTEEQETKIDALTTAEEPKPAKPEHKASKKGKKTAKKAPAAPQKPHVAPAKAKGSRKATPAKKPASGVLSPL
jgi:hypothetical protein